MSEPLSQAAYAERLAHELWFCGHEDLVGVDILDALASVGLLLTEGTGAAAAYTDEIAATEPR